MSDKNTTWAKSSFERNRFILTSLVSKDFKLKYRRSILGVLWSILNPLLMMIVLSAVFSFMFRFEIENFPLYLILGQTVFTLMTDATSGALRSIIDASQLIKKIRIEKMIFPIEKVLFSLVNFALSLVAVAAVMIFFQIAPTWNIVFLPLLILYLCIFCIGWGLLLSALAVFFRDIIHLWTVITTAWMYATPIFYPIELLPDFLQKLMPFNPMYQFVTYFREIMLWGMTPSLEQNLMCIGFSIVMLLIGALLFRKTEKKFILYV